MNFIILPEMPCPYISYFFIFIFFLLCCDSSHVELFFYISAHTWLKNYLYILPFSSISDADTSYTLLLPLL